MVMGATGCSKQVSNTSNNTTNTTISAIESTPAPKEINYLDYTNTSFDKSKASAKIELGTYKGLDLGLDLLTVKDEDVVTQIESNFSKREEIKEGVVENGDSLNIDFIGKIDGKEFDGGSAKGQSITIGSGGYIPGFEEGLIGVEIGGIKDVTVTFPSDYGVDTLNGKEAVFTITVNYKLGDSYIPELTDEFISTETQEQYKTYDEYFNYIKEAMQQEYDYRNNNSKKDLLMAKLVETSKVEAIDQSEIDQYVESAVNYYKEMIASNGSTFEDYLKSLNVDETGFKDMIVNEYKSMMTNTLILYKIAENEKLELTNDEIEDALSDTYAQYSYSDAETFANDLITQNMMGDFINGVKENKVLEMLISNNNFKAKE